MRTTTETKQAPTPESIVQKISVLDIQDCRTSLRAMMDSHFLICARTGGNPEPCWCAYQSIDALLESLQQYHQQEKLKKVA